MEYIQTTLAVLSVLVLIDAIFWNGQLRHEMRYEFIGESTRVKLRRGIKLRLLVSLLLISLAALI